MRLLTEGVRGVGGESDTDKELNTDLISRINLLISVG
jgi:hypothetical protein